jgi:hypothetical protein
MQIADMASTGKETTFCMGDDAPLGPTLPASMPHALGRPHTLGRMPCYLHMQCMLLHMCLCTAIQVSSCYCLCVLIYCIRPHVLYTSSCTSVVMLCMCPHMCGCSCCYICVLREVRLCVCVCPDTSMCVSYVVRADGGRAAVLSSKPQVRILLNIYSYIY